MFTFGLGHKPEYCFSVIDGVGLGQKPVTPWIVPDVEDARKRLARANVQWRTQALMALQRRAQEVLSVYEEDVAQRGNT